MEKELKLYKKDKRSPFPNSSGQVTLTSFTYNAQRMATTSTITASFMYPRCLDNEWTEDVFAEFNDEKYYVKSVPSSSKDNKTLMYKHEITLYSERFILDNTYFYNAVKAEGTTDIVANSTNVTTVANLYEFANRINASLEYSKLDYRIDLTNIASIKGYDEPKQISLDKTFISTALQEIYNQWNALYYFKGKVIRIGESSIIDTPFEYGAKNNLLSVKKDNSNYKTINRCSGIGSDKNLPYYYPNESPKGITDVRVLPSNKYLKQTDIEVIDKYKFNRYIPLNSNVVYRVINDIEPKWHGNEPPIFSENFKLSESNIYSGYISASVSDVRKSHGYIEVSFKCMLTETFSVGREYRVIRVDWDENLDQTYKHFISKMDFDNCYILSSGSNALNSRIAYSVSGIESAVINVNSAENADGTVRKYTVSQLATVTLTFLASGAYSFDLDELNIYNLTISPSVIINEDITRGDVKVGRLVEGAGYLNTDILATIPKDYQGSYMIDTYSLKYSTDIKENGWFLESNNKKVELNEVGLRLKGVTPNDNWSGDGFKQEKIGWITPSQNLMPTIYSRGSIEDKIGAGKEIFYNAINGKYIDKETGSYYTFENLWNPNTQREHIEDFEDIYPTIKNVVNNNLQQIDKVAAVAFDDDDNNEVNDEGDYLHPYFYVKLKKTDGEDGFNIFDHKAKGQNMTLSFTSGNCAAAMFEIQVNTKADMDSVGYEKVINPIQVDESGNLVKGNWQEKTSGTPIDSQQDSSKNEIWIILKKDNSTFNDTLPNSVANIVPTDKDSFVLLNIDMPIGYVINAEKKLDEAIIKYMSENNSDKFNFTIDFSRIYLQENPTVKEQLNENAKVKVIYNGTEYPLYINNFTYDVKNNELLPKISVGLADTITVNRGITQTIADGIMKDIITSVNTTLVIDKQSNDSRYISKEEDDATPFNLGIGGNLNVDNNINAKEKVTSKTIVSPSFSGTETVGSGFQLDEDKNGISTLTVDNINVRRKLQVTEFVIQQIKFQGGIIWHTAAGITCTKVEVVADNYRCYFDNQNGTISNLFKTDDLARCQRVGVSPKYYWRLVSNVGIDYIDLSIDGCDANSDIPTEGDVIVQLGNYTDVTRQSAIEINTIGEQAPSFKMYSGINSYSLYQKDITGIVFDKQDKKPSLYSYGDMFFGDKQNSTYIKYDASQKQMDIKARLSVTSPSGGTDNIDNVLNNIDNKAQNAQDSINNLHIGGKNLIPKSKNCSEIQNEGYGTTRVTKNVFEDYTEFICQGGNNIWQWVSNLLYVKDINFNVQYTLSFDIEVGSFGTAINIRTKLAKEKGTTVYQEEHLLANEKKRVVFTGYVFPNANLQLWVGNYYGINNFNFKLSNLKLEIGNKATDWTPSEQNQVTEMIDNSIVKGSTDILGGLVLTNLMALKDTQGNVTAGVSGLTKDSSDIHFWGGSDLANIKNAPFRVYNNGSCYATNFYGFNSAFKINNDTFNDCVKDGIIDFKKTGWNIIIERNASGYQLPIGEEYIGAEVQILNPYKYPLITCGYTARNYNTKNYLGSTPKTPTSKGVEDPNNKGNYINWTIDGGSCINLVTPFLRMTCVKTTLEKDTVFPNWLTTIKTKGEYAKYNDNYKKASEICEFAVWVQTF